MIFFKVFYLVVTNLPDNDCLSFFHESMCPFGKPSPAPGEIHTFIGTIY